MFTSLDILDVAVQLERNGEKIFRDAARAIENTELAELLEWMADQEKEHVDYFENMKKTVKKPFDDPTIQEMGREILQDALEGVGFDLGNVDFSKMEEIRELLNASIEFEKDTATFYELLKSFVVDDETRELLEKIIEEEHNHARLLREFVKSAQMA